MPFITNYSYIDYDINFIGTNTYDISTGPNNQVKITASDGATDDQFGYSVAVGLGCIVVGAKVEDELGTSAGAAYIFDLNGNQIKKIKASDGAEYDFFGHSVAIGSGRIVVGAEGDESNRGAAYIFDLNGNQIAKITASDGVAGDRFGWSVAAGSGRIVVGAYGDDDLGSDSGSAYIFDLNGNQIAKIKASDGAASDYFGWSVAAGSGRIVVGAHLEDNLGAGAGAAYIFDLNGNQIAKITASDGASPHNFGYSVATGSGRIVVGAYRDEDLGTNSGSAYIFDLNGNQIAKITASDGADSDQFGYSVAISSGRIVIGARGDNSNRGAVYIFDLNGNQITKITASDGAASDYFGWSVAIGPSRIVVGSYLDDDVGSGSGSAYIYSINRQTHFLDILE